MSVYHRVEVLRAEIEGAVFLPGDPGYDAECYSYNLLTPPAPAVVVAAASAGDVQTAVRFAAANGLAVGVRGGGHMQPPTRNDALLITLDRMSEVLVDQEHGEAWVIGGARWQHVLDAAAPYGLAPLSGSAPTVGAIGYLLGGGQSPVLGRLHGFASDHVVEFAVVTADGELRTVSRSSEPELFDALKGTRGNLGVVTAARIRLFPYPAIFGGGLYFAGEHLADLLPVWRDWATALPDAASTAVGILRLPPAPELPEPLRGAFVVHVRFSFAGAADEGAAVLAPMRAAGVPLLDSVAEIPYVATGSIYAEPPNPLPFVDRSFGVRELPDEALTALVEAAGPDAALPPAVVEIRALGGALDRAPAEADAVVRGVPYQVLTIGVGAPHEVEALGKSLEVVADALHPWRCGGMVNFLPTSDALDQAAVSALYGPELHDRLLAVKQKYDPNNIFRLNSNLAVD
ncbi:FAD-binding oxidoreductase [Kribbella albertanoniae]|uniref:FAD-binding oxidoreductase n=1 Tax=Kribbella albertanoniae TaxID=1266829 RepID=A0A4R4PT89_9ACTN|nr:FAD-binding oxidoreductase [Kribbella albertanoniae]TDC25449.1 FAD-binding oxidoreductase [Kribbella albertanoniae]